MKTNISQIPNEVLARLFFRRLWQGYDSGGFSVGRSIQSSLVEAYIALNQYDNLPEFPLDLRELANEAKRRSDLIYKQSVIGNLENLSLISDSDISLLCIEALRVWYQIHSNEKHPQGYTANAWEGVFVDSICKIMPIPFFPYFRSDKDIIKICKEAEERVVIRYTESIFTI